MTPCQPEVQNPKWIKFRLHHRQDGRMTDVWDVVSAPQFGVLLGEIRWYARWRKYSFFPNRNVDLVFEKDCLRDIADFCETETAHRKAERQNA